MLVIGVQNSRGLRKPSVNALKKNQTVEFVNHAATEDGVTKYFCNRNPRNLELMGIAEKPKGFEKKRYRVDYHHRYVASSHDCQSW